MLARYIAGKEPVFRPFHSPPGSQDLQQFWGEHDVAILHSLALLDSQDHALAIDGGGCKSDGFGDAQAGGVAGGQDGTVLPAPHTGQKLQDFLGTEDHRQGLRPFRSGDDVGEGPVLFESDFIQEAKRGNGNEDRTGSQLLFLRQVDLIGTNLSSDKSFRIGREDRTVGSQLLFLRQVDLIGTNLLRPQPLLEALAALFTQGLRLCQKAGLVKLGHVAIDGTKIQGNASKHKAMSYERMGETEKKLKEEVEALLQRANAVDAAEDDKYGKGQSGDELPAELARRESRLAKIRAAKAELEAEAQQKAEEKKAAAEAKIAERREQEARTGKKAGGRDPQVPDPAQAEPDPKAQRSFTDPESRIMPRAC
jgi:hypothetical protein